jgi:hypothetical protein
MTMQGRRRGGSVAFALAIAFASIPAAATTKDQCIDANGRAQELRREGKLAAARVELDQCVHPSCPPLIRDDCAKRLDDLEGAQPTIAFEVKDAAGADVSVVKITVDGTPLAARLTGMALPVDIGDQLFIFEAVGQPPVTRRLVVTEGEKGRREIIVLGSASSSTRATLPPGVAAAVVSAPLAASPASPGTEQSSAGGRLETRTVVGLVTGGVGVVGMGVGSVFGLLTLSNKNLQQQDCGMSASCTSSGHAKALDDHSAATTDGTLSTIGFVAGGALLIAAVVLLTTGHASHAPATGMLVLAPSLTPDRIGTGLTGTF